MSNRDTMITTTTIDPFETAVRAVRFYAESHPRPSQVTQAQAAEMLNISRATVSRMVRAGTIRLNAAGMISISEIDRLLSTDRT